MAAAALNFSPSPFCTASKTTEYPSGALATRETPCAPTQATDASSVAGITTNAVSEPVNELVTAPRCKGAASVSSEGANPISPKS